MNSEQNNTIGQKDKIHRTCKKAARDLIDRCGGVDKAKFASRIRRSALADAANFNVRNRYLPIDVMYSLETAVGEPVATRLLAHELGYVIFPIPSAAPESIWQKHLNRVVRKSSRLFKHILDALKDDQISADEAEDLLEQTDTTLAAVGSLRSALVAKMAQKRRLPALRRAS